MFTQCDAQWSWSCNVSLYREFQHDKLLKLYGICTQGGPVFIITELLAKGILDLWTISFPPPTNIMSKPPSSWALDLTCMDTVALSFFMFRMHCRFLAWISQAAPCTSGENRVASRHGHSDLLCYEVSWEQGDCPQRCGMQSRSVIHC